MPENENIISEENTNTRFKLIKMLEKEHEYILKLNNKEGEGSEQTGPFIILNDDTYDKYEIDDIVKSEYSTFWKITGITYCFRYTENPEFERCIWETKEKMRKNMRNHGQCEYSIIYLSKISDAEAAKLLDTEYDPTQPDPYGC